jgi:hypothetical protein
VKIWIFIQKVDNVTFCLIEGVIDERDDHAFLVSTASRTSAMLAPSTRSYAAPLTPNPKSPVLN